MVTQPSYVLVSALLPTRTSHLGEWAGDYFSCLFLALALFPTLTTVVPISNRLGTGQRWQRTRHRTDRRVLNEPLDQSTVKKSFVSAEDSSRTVLYNIWSLLNEVSVYGLDPLSPTCVDACVVKPLLIFTVFAQTRVVAHPPSAIRTVSWLWPLLMDRTWWLHWCWAGCAALQQHLWYHSCTKVFWLPQTGSQQPWGWVAYGFYGSFAITASRWRNLAEMCLRLLV